MVNIKVDMGNFQKVGRKAKNEGRIYIGLYADKEKNPALFTEISKFKQESGNVQNELLKFIVAYNKKMVRFE